MLVHGTIDRFESTRSAIPTRVVMSPGADFGTDGKLRFCAFHPCQNQHLRISPRKDMTDSSFGQTKSGAGEVPDRGKMPFLLCGKKLFKTW